MATIFQELQRILKLQQASGVERAWISEENLRALYALPNSAVQRQQPSATQPNAPAQHNAAQPPAAQPQVRTAVPGPVASNAAVANTSEAAVTTQQPETTNAPSQTPPTGFTPKPVQRRYAMPRQQQQPDTKVPLTPMPSVDSLDWEQLKQTAFACQACKLHASRTNLVFEDGCRQARVMFIGEGPGQDEDLQGVPFVGRAGQLLTRMILAMGLDRAATTPEKGAYIANIVKCRPPSNRNPENDEGIVCINFLKRQIQLVKPEVIVLLGAVPLNFLMGKSGITRCRGQWLDYEGIPVMPTFHPAYLLRFERQREQFILEKRKVWEDLQKVMAKLNLQRPQ